ncbi:hypothetical protein [Thioclava sp. JM3]|uniref:hypothetical protein n=1 Tax=Thioclava sp. JM3 TaxID=1973004 RepID=UPI00117D04A9|nr:hypothetical protein [Thioclava sp. JM3]
MNLKSFPLLIALIVFMGIIGSSEACASSSPPQEILASISERNAALKKCVDLDFNDPAHDATCRRAEILEKQIEAKGWCKAREVDAPQLTFLPCDGYRWYIVTPKLGDYPFGIQVDSLSAEMLLPLTRSIRKKTGESSKVDTGFMKVACSEQETPMLFFATDQTTPEAGQFQDVVMNTGAKKISASGMRLDDGDMIAFAVTNIDFIDAFLRELHRNIGTYRNIDFTFTSQDTKARAVFSLGALQLRFDQMDDEALLKKSVANVTKACDVFSGTR